MSAIKVISFVKVSFANTCVRWFADMQKAVDYANSIRASLPDSYDVVIEDPNTTHNERLERIALLGVKNVFDVDDLALYIGKSPKTIRNIIDSIPHYKDPRGQLSFVKSEIDAWLTRVKCATINL